MPKTYFYIIGISTIVSLFYYKKFANTKNSYFIFFIFYTFLIDKICYINSLTHFISKDNLHNNNPILNIYAISTYLFFLLFYRHLSKNKRNRILLKYFLIIYILFIFFDFFILKTHFINEIITKTIIVGSVLFLITLILFLIEIINNESIIFNIEKSFIFWVSVGCLLFYVGVIPIMISSKQLFFKGIFEVILNILNGVAHSLFIVGYIWSDKKYNY